MSTSNPTNDPKNATANEARIWGALASDDFRELTLDEEKNVVGGAPSTEVPPGDARVNSELENFSN